MDYLIAIISCCAVVLVLVILVMFAILCRKKNKCDTNYGKKDNVIAIDNDFNHNDNKKKLIWNKFASKPTSNIVVKVGQYNTANRNSNRPGPSMPTVQ